MFNNYIQLVCINEQKQDITVYINPTYIVSATPLNHLEFGDVVIFQTINGTFIAKSQSNIGASTAQ